MHFEDWLPVLGIKPSDSSPNANFNERFHITYCKVIPSETQDTIETSLAECMMIETKSVPIFPPTDDWYVRHNCFKGRRRRAGSSHHENRTLLK